MNGVILWFIFSFIFLNTKTNVATNLTLKQLGVGVGRGGGGVNLTILFGFLKNASSEEKVKPWFFVTFNITISHILGKLHLNSSSRSEDMKNFSFNISYFYRFSSSFWILTFPCYKETSDVSL